MRLDKQGIPYYTAFRMEDRSWYIGGNIGLQSIKWKGSNTIP